MQQLNTVLLITRKCEEELELVELVKKSHNKKKNWFQLPKYENVIYTMVTNTLQ